MGRVLALLAWLGALLVASASSEASTEYLETLAKAQALCPSSALACPDKAASPASGAETRRSENPLDKCTGSKDGCGFDDLAAFAQGEFSECGQLFSGEGTLALLHRHKDHHEGVVGVGKGMTLKTVSVEEWLGIVSQTELLMKKAMVSIKDEFIKVKITNCDFNVKPKISFNPTKVVKEAKKLVKSVNKMVDCGKKMVTDVLSVNDKVGAATRKFNSVRQMDEMATQVKNLILVTQQIQESRHGRRLLGRRRKSAASKKGTSAAGIQRRKKSKPAAPKAPQKSSPVNPAPTPAPKPKAKHGSFFSSCSKECTNQRIANPSMEKEFKQKRRQILGEELGESIGGRRRRRKKDNKKPSSPSKPSTPRSKPKPPTLQTICSQRLDKLDPHQKERLLDSKFCVNDPSVGLGSDRCLSCQHKACVKEHSAGQCWKCKILTQGSSLGFLCSSGEGQSSTSCKALLTDEQQAPWKEHKIDVCKRDSIPLARCELKGSCLPVQPSDCKCKKQKCSKNCDNCCRRYCEKGQTSQAEDTGEGEGVKVLPFPLLKQVHCSPGTQGEERCTVKKASPCMFSSSSTNDCSAGTEQLLMTKTF